MTEPLYLSRARLRTGRGEALSAIAPLLIPDDDARRAGHAHRLTWLLFQDVPDAKRDFLWRDEGNGRSMILSRRAPTDPNGLFDLDTKPFKPALKMVEVGIGAEQAEWPCSILLGYDFDRCRYQFIGRQFVEPVSEFFMQL